MRVGGSQFAHLIVVGSEFQEDELRLYIDCHNVEPSRTSVEEEKGYLKHLGETELKAERKRSREGYQHVGN